MRPIGENVTQLWCTIHYKVWSYLSDVRISPIFCQWILSLSVQLGQSNPVHGQNVPDKNIALIGEWPHFAVHSTEPPRFPKRAAVECRCSSGDKPVCSRMRNRCNRRLGWRRFVLQTKRIDEKRRLIVSIGEEVKSAVELNRILTDESSGYWIVVSGAVAVF
jgi:hypothetical protein